MDNNFVKTNMVRAAVFIISALFIISLSACRLLPPTDKSGKTESTAPSTTEETTFLPYEPENFDIEKKVYIDKCIDNMKTNWDVDADAIVQEAYDKYGKLFYKKIGTDALRTAVVAHNVKKDENFSGITDDALKEVNIFLKDKGLDPLDSKTPAQSVAALGISASIWIEKNYKDDDIDKYNDEKYEELLPDRLKYAFMSAWGTNENTARTFKQYYYVLR